MKVTKEQLKQIIREELSEQSFMDRLKGFFGGKKYPPTPIFWLPGAGRPGSGMEGGSGVDRAPRPHPQGAQNPFDG